MGGGYKPVELNTNFSAFIELIVLCHPLFFFLTKKSQIKREETYLYYCDDPYEQCRGYYLRNQSHTFHMSLQTHQNQDYPSTVSQNQGQASFAESVESRATKKYDLLTGKSICFDIYNTDKQGSVEQTPGPRENNDGCVVYH